MDENERTPYQRKIDDDKLLLDQLVKDRRLSPLTGREMLVPVTSCWHWFLGWACFWDGPVFVCIG